ncbi:patatin-like phospholipase family protein [Shewanella yunxiaonensis]|uniref:Patatin-like phospholipase family protein n=1 Tax=Shewanella yunxiaonensis TaxID=2829809 RepID=A0ABX7YR40_9GAMM|nr:MULTISPECIES: patatin-like phospholipase family protein [Shewanella]MDF0534510.1 patatin-like phospholipase family protein [Shewanella sp. A32]QUN04865.1 patatin-like phospholipase family protein [Shewanella yunxiaonensis]
MAVKESCALMLGGGGARAAYQVGVLKALAQLYPRNHGIPFDVICGTSAGAINGTAMATHASCFHLGVKKLEWIWRHLDTSRIYKSSIPGVLQHLSAMFLKGMQTDLANTDAGSLLDNAPLRDLLNELINFERIDRNIENGHLTAISIDTSCYNNSQSVSFFQAKSELDDWRRARRSGVRTRLNTEHLMASSAIPLVFPSIRLGKWYYGDGSVHQLAPLSCPIHLGASRIMVINLESPHKQQPKDLEYHPKTATVAGHLLDTIFSDTLNSDLERLTRVNGTLSLIPPTSRELLSLRNIDTLVIKPSEDLSEIAKRFYMEIPFAIRRLLGLIGINSQSESSIVSYLLFEKAYTGTLIELGFNDAMTQMDEIKAFFNIAR